MPTTTIQQAKKPVVSKRSPQRKPQLASNRFTRYFLGPIIAFIVFVSTWQLIPLMLGIPHYILPKPTDVVASAASQWPLLSEAVSVTVVVSAIGFLLSAVIGVGISILLASSKVIERSIYPYAIILQTLPVVAIAPIIVIWFGAGFNAIVVVSFLIGFFPIVSNTLMGLNSVNKQMDELFSLYNASKWQKMWRLRVPAALPFMMAGLKISATLSIVGAIVGEYVAGVGGGKGGIGYAITVAAIQVNTSFIFALAICGAILGIGFYLAMSLLSKVVLGSWHESSIKQDL